MSLWFERAVGSSSETRWQLCCCGHCPPTQGGPHRQHFHKDATDWRVSSGMDKVRKAVVRGNRFDVYLGAGKTFEGVRVEYKDGAGVWHAH